MCKFMRKKLPQQS